MSIDKINKEDKKLTKIFKIIFILFSLFTIYPVLFLFLTSLKSTTDFYTNIWGIPANFEWKNYSYAWDVAKIGEYFFVSVRIVGIVVICTLFISSLAGYALAKLRIKHSQFIMFGIFLLTMLPSESLIMPMYIINSKMKMTGTYQSLILPYIGWGASFATYIYYNFFLTVPMEIIEAGRIDGCSEFRIFWKIVLPLMLPATATAAIFNFLGWWGEMLWASIELSVSSIKTLPLGVLAFVQSTGTNWGPLCAASCIIIIPLIVIFLMFQKYFISGLTGGAVKG